MLRLEIFAIKAKSSLDQLRSLEIETSEIINIQPILAAKSLIHFDANETKNGRRNGTKI